MSFVLSLHSVLRWILIALAAGATLRFALALARKAAFGRIDRALGSAFSGLMDVQVLLGVVYLVWNGMTGAGFPLYRIEHAGVMLLAGVAGHLPMHLRAANDSLRFRHWILGILGALALVVVGVFILPGGWTR